jgi:predicted regulator of Ras-like GTPase activity (Roadblock/LC7/MglB family)
MTQTNNPSEQLSWLLDNLVSRVANVSQALVLSRDGLVVAKSRGMSTHLTAAPRTPEHPAAR